MSKSVFVTVGSTKFDELISAVLLPENLQILYSQGYGKIKIQYGKGNVIPPEGKIQIVESKELIKTKNIGNLSETEENVSQKHDGRIKIESFRYKDSIAEDFKDADLIISHAGAGSCIEALEANKLLVAVVNESLMDNHQQELAEALSKEGFCKWCFVNSLTKNLSDLPNEKIIPYVPGNIEKFIEFLNNMFDIE